VHFWTADNAAEWRTPKFKGLNVYNNNNEKLGDIDDILVDHSGQIKAVIIGVGGFLGIGEHNVAVPFNELQFVYNTANRNVAGANNTAANNNLAARNNAASPGTATTAGTANTGLGSAAAPGAANTTTTGTAVAPGAANTNASTATGTPGTGVGGSGMASNNAGNAGNRNAMPDRAILNATKDQLKGAPQFKYNG